jgi:hypothetical protein
MAAPTTSPLQGNCMIKYIAINLPDAIAFEGLNDEQVNELIADNDLVLRVHSDGNVEEYDSFYECWSILESHSYYLT